MCVLARRIAVLAVTVVVAVTAKFQSPPPSRHLNDPPPLPTSVNIKVDGVLMRSTGTPVPTTTVVTAAMGVLASSDEKMVPGEPHFDYSLPTEISAVVGKAAYLSCRVKNAGNWTISWMRVTDMHILTAGAYTYTSDQRYATNYIESTGEWVLTIKWTQEGDSGRYDCQTSTMPIRSFTVLLHVIVPSAVVLGGPEMYVNKGSTINVTCVITSPEAPAYVFWYHEDEIISYDSPRGGVSVITEKGEETVSYLLIQDARQTDSGRYSCSPSNAEVAYIHVHVLNSTAVKPRPVNALKEEGSQVGEKTEAQQTNRKSGVTLIRSDMYLLGFAVCFCLNVYFNIPTNSVSFLTEQR